MFLRYSNCVKFYQNISHQGDQATSTYHNLYDFRVEEVYNICCCSNFRRW